jgi:hypothetical protein
MFEHARKQDLSQQLRKYKIRNILYVPIVNAKVNPKQEYLGKFYFIGVNVELLWFI